MQNPLSPRSQFLPLLAKTTSRSDANSSDLSKGPQQFRQRHASYDAIDSVQLTNNDLEAQRNVNTGRGSRRWQDAIAAVLLTPQMRSQRLIGNSNPRYRWERYYTPDDRLKGLRSPIRAYYERNNYLIQQYAYIDRLLDSSLPHNLIQEYQTIGSRQESHASSSSTDGTVTDENGNTEEPDLDDASGKALNSRTSSSVKIRRTPSNLYRVHTETRPLLSPDNEEGEHVQSMPMFEPEAEHGSQSRTVTVAIYINLVANTVLLIFKIIATLLTSSVSVLASLVDAALDFLSTAIVWTTTRLISHNDDHAYPVGRRRLEPLGVLVFSVVMITSFVQVGIEGFNHLTANDHAIVQLTAVATSIMVCTVIIKFLCWLWCRTIKNSSVQALAQDAVTDCVFNTFSVIFPLVGFYAKIWWLDPLGGIILSLYVIINWSKTSASHIKNLSGAAASADERNVLLYLTMRFAKTIKGIQSLTAYRVGDAINVEADIVLDEKTNLRDSHDLGESLQYVLESVPFVERAFVHLDYDRFNLPSHMKQQQD